MLDESTLLLTGGTGRLGKACRKFFPKAHLTGRRQLEVTSTESVASFFRNNAVSTVVHMASLASVSGCEQNPAVAYDVNVMGTRRVIEAAKAYGVKRFFYLSTACVFPGTDPTAMADEDALPYPKHYYGLTKYAAEEICRTFHSPDFEVTVLRTNFTSMPWTVPKAFTDRFGTYLFAQGVAKGLRDVWQESTWHPTLHICGDRKLSMYEYAVLGGSPVAPLTLADYHGVPLTVNMSLTSKYWRVYRLEDSSPNDD